MTILRRRRIAEQIILALLDRLLEERALDSEMLFLPAREMRGRDLLRYGHVPAEILDWLLGHLDGAVATAAAELLAGLGGRAA
jgi:hypothetical protein